MVLPFRNLWELGSTKGLVSREGETFFEKNFNQTAFANLT
jgi:hypothetical protein